MRPLARHVRVMFGLATLVAVLAAWPGAASADLKVDKVTIDGVVDGVTSSSSPPGGVLPAKVEVSGSSNWESTDLRVGNQTDCDNRDSNDDEDDNYTHNITAPGVPDDYDVGVTVYSEEGCKGTESSEKVLTDALNVTEPGANPNLPPKCGINVILVLDESGSIGSNAENVRRASRAFLNALSGTGSKVSIVDFSTRAARPVAYTPVTGRVDPNGQNGTGTIGSTFEPYLKTGYVSSGWTNWEDAFEEVKVANDTVVPPPPAPDGKKTKADLVVFMTDGDPTAMNTDGGGVDDGLVEGDVEALRRAAAQADFVKGQKSHVLAMGVGAAVTDGNSARRLTAISGFDKWPSSGVSFEEADYTLVENFDDLAAALRQIAIALCKASVTVTKLVDETPSDGIDNYQPADGWTFTADVTVPGGYKWVQPEPPPDTGQVSADEERRRAEQPGRGHVPVEAHRPNRDEHRHDDRAGEARLHLRGLHVREERTRQDHKDSPDVHNSEGGYREPRPERVRQVHRAKQARSPRERHDQDHQGRGAERRPCVQLHRRLPHWPVPALGQRQAGAAHIQRLHRPTRHLPRERDPARFPPPLGAGSDVDPRGDQVQQPSIPRTRPRGLDHRRTQRAGELHVPERPGR